jgi:hypothetical protein
MKIHKVLKYHPNTFRFHLFTHLDIQTKHAFFISSPIIIGAVVIVIVWYLDFKLSM